MRCRCHARILADEIPKEMCADLARFRATFDEVPATADISHAVPLQLWQVVSRQRTCRDAQLARDLFSELVGIVAYEVEHAGLSFSQRWLRCSRQDRRAARRPQHPSGRGFEF